MPKVLVIMGSASDKEKTMPCVEVLQSLGISFKLTISSAHRTPERTAALVEEGEKNGVKVYICAAGMAAHLGGALASRTIRPVIGIPISGASLAGLDALLSTVQMPAAYPVATMALDKSGAKNAAWLAAQILAISDPSLAAKIVEERKRLKDAVEEAAMLTEAEVPAVD